MHIARSDRINWSWYIGYEIVDLVDGVEHVRITLHDRLHIYDPRQGAEHHPKVVNPLGIVDVVEDSNRNVVALTTMDNKHHPVVNVDNIFSYPTFVRPGWALPETPADILIRRAQDERRRSA